jgi:cytochrome c556
MRKTKQPRAPALSAGLTTIICMAPIYTGTALADVGAAADTVKVRQHGLKDLGAAFKLVKDQTSSGNPDVDKIKSAADTIKQAAAEFPKWFPPGSDASAGVKTAAKPEIWSDPAAYATARDNFVAQAGKFVALAASGDAAAIRDGVKPLGQTCGGCHDKFRVKQD